MGAFSQACRVDEVDVTTRDVFVCMRVGNRAWVKYWILKKKVRERERRAGSSKMGELTRRVRH